MYKYPNRISRGGTVGPEAFMVAEVDKIFFDCKPCQLVNNCPIIVVSCWGQRCSLKRRQFLNN
jgi:hypothetical protein